MSNGRVFISYAAPDHESAELVCEQLEAEQIACWIAPRDVPPGQRYAEAIFEGIGACALFLIVFSEHATASPHVCNEIEEGASEDKPILLVRTDAADPAANHQIRLFLRSHQWFDASIGPLADHMPRLIADVRQLLGRQDLGAGVIGGANVIAPVGAAPSLDTRAAQDPAASEAKRSIGIEVGATKIRGCVIDLDTPDSADPKITAYVEPTTTGATARTVLDQVRQMIERILADHFEESRPVGIGVAVPGQVDIRAGTLKFGPNLFGARNVPFKTFLSSAFPRIPIRVDNEVRCATRCELHVGVGRDFESFVCIFIGKGVGSGTVIDRRIYFGHNFCAGEVGHVKIALTGAPCACGQIGCLETFVKADAIVARSEAKAIDWESRGLETALNRGDGRLTPELIAQAIDEADPAAQEIANEIAENLGIGIANYLNLVNPAAVVIGGGIMTGFFFHMIDEITQTVQRNALAEVANTPIVQSAHSEDGIATGAALLFHPDDSWPF
jgi:glucokinase